MLCRTVQVAGRVPYQAGAGESAVRTAGKIVECSLSVLVQSKNRAAARCSAGFGCALEVTHTVTNQRGEGIRAVRGWTVKRVEYGKSLGLKPA